MQTYRTYKYGCMREGRIMVIEKLTESVHVKFSKRTLQALNRLHKRSGASMSWIIRYALNDYLSRKGAFVEDAR